MIALFSWSVVAAIGQSDSNWLCIENVIPKDMFYPESVDIYPWPTCEALKWDDENAARSSNNCNTRIWITDTMKVKLMYADWIPWDNWSTELNLDASIWESWVIVFTANPWPEDVVDIHYDDIDCEPAISTKTVNLFGTALWITLQSSSVKSITDAIVAVNWKTSYEVNADYFVIFRETKESYRSIVDTIMALWNTSVWNAYWTQDTIDSPGVYSYSMAEVDVDWNTKEYFLWNISISPEWIWTITVYPNPTTWELYFENVSIDNIKNACIVPIGWWSQYDIITQEELKRWKIDLSGLTQWIYLIIIADNYWNRIQKKIIITH